MFHRVFQENGSVLDETAEDMKDANDQQNIDAVAASEGAQRLLDAVNHRRRPDGKKIIEKTAIRRIPSTYSPGGSSPVSSGVRGLKEMNARILVKKFLRKKVQDNRR